MLETYYITLFSLSLLAALMPAWYVLRFNLHMLQLNVYKNFEQVSWLKENARKQWLLGFLVIVGVMDCIFPNVVLHIILAVTYYLVFIVYRAMKRIYGKKKPLVFTSRVKRIVVTDLILSIIVLLIGFFTQLGPGVVGVVVGLQFVLVMLANLINSPIERGIRNYYINDAKRILKSCDNLVIIGITGSYGKTSMKFYLRDLLQSHFNVLATPESYNTPMGIVKTIRESLSPRTEVFICEMGARYVGEIKEICDIVHPHHGVITSIGPAHLSTFGSLENIQKTKFELSDALPRSGMLFLNADSELVVEEANKRDINAIFYSAADSAEADFIAEIKQLSDIGTDFSFRDASANKTCEYHTKLVGQHNVINLAGALAIACKLGIDLDELKIPMRRIASVPHRMELKKHGRLTIIDDAFNSNPVGSKAAVETLSMFDGIRVLLTPGMVELGDDEEKYNEQFGRYAAHCSDWIVLVGEARTKPIASGAQSEGFDIAHIKAYNTFDEAYAFASKIDTNGKQLYILFENDLPDNYYSIT